MNKNTARTIAKHGLALCQRAYALNRDGEGCSTIGIYLGVHWKTADALVNAGRDLAESNADFVAQTLAAPAPFAVGDSVVVRLDNGTEQSAILMHFSKGTSQCHTFAHFAWKTGPSRWDTSWFVCHSTRLRERVLAVFPKDAKFLAV